MLGEFPEGEPLGAAISQWAHHPARVPHRYHIVRDGLGDHAAGADGGVVANGHVGADGDVEGQFGPAARTTGSVECMAAEERWLDVDARRRLAQQLGQQRAALLGSVRPGAQQSGRMNSRLVGLRPRARPRGCVPTSSTQAARRGRRTPNRRRLKGWPCSCRPPPPTPHAHISRHPSRRPPHTASPPLLPHHLRPRPPDALERRRGLVRRTVANGDHANQRDFGGDVQQRAAPSGRTRQRRRPPTPRPPPPAPPPPRSRCLCASTAPAKIDLAAVGAHLVGLLVAAVIGGLAGAGDDQHRR